MLLLKPTPLEFKRQPWSQVGNLLPKLLNWVKRGSHGGCHLASTVLHVPQTWSDAARPQWKEQVNMPRA
jgi:hypothetical protein